MLRILPISRKQSLSEEEDMELCTNQIEYKEYNYKYVISLLYYTATICSTILQITCSPISNTLQSVYNLTPHQIDFTSLLQTIIYIPANIPATYIINKYGLRIGISTGLVFCIIGAWIRIAINISFQFVVTGQVIAAGGNAFIINCLTTLSGNWFKSETRFNATTINMLSSSLGTAIGFFIPPSYIKEANKYETIQEAQIDIFNLFWTEAVIVSVLALPCIAFFRDKPPKPPSAAAHYKQNDNFQKTLQAIKNKDFFCLVLSFSFGAAISIGLQVVITSIVIPFGFSEQEAAYFGTLYNFGSIIGLIQTLFLMKIAKSYKFIIVLSYILSISSLVFFTGALVWEYDSVINLAAVLLGVGLQLFWNVSLELGCELTFPLNETSSSSWLQTSGSLLSIFHVFIMEYCMRNKTTSGSLAATFVNISFILAALLCTSSIQETLKRFEFENTQKNNQVYRHQELPQEPSDTDTESTNHNEKNQ